MGKQGPCCHCGVSSTPLWRNGPPEKPVLCNACGSRYRTKGTLVNYTPLHSRDENDIEDRRVQRMMIKIPKRKSYQERNNFEYNTSFKKKKFLEEEFSNRSSSGSVVSNSESCDQRRTRVVGRPKTASSSVEKLTKDLYSILQEQQSSWLSFSPEEELLYENETPMLIGGHGSFLMRDEESEASSLVSLNQNFPETNVVMRSPEVKKIRSNHSETDEVLDKSVSSLNPMSYGGSLVCSYGDDDGSDHDLLLDIPSNGSFPQAELLHII